MNRFYNIIESQESCCLMLYGVIGNWGDVKDGDIVRDLLAAANKGLSIDVHINSVGGDVYSAIAIFNALRNCSAPITIYIDCIAASAASFIAACGKPVKICSNGRIMIHRVQCGIDGNADEITQRVEEMRGLEELLCQMYASRTGLSVEDIRTTYFDGKDHWLTATEALSLGLVDEIYDDPLPLPPDVLQKEPAAISAAYTTRYYNSLKNFENMAILDEIRQCPTFTACADEAAVMARLSQLEADAAEAETLRTENATLKTANAAYAATENTAREAALDAEVDAAHEEQRIADSEVPSFKALMRKDAENTRALIAARKPKRRLDNLFSGKNPEPKSAWEERMDEIRNKLKK